MKWEQELKEGREFIKNEFNKRYFMSKNGAKIMEHLEGWIEFLIRGNNNTNEYQLNFPAELIVKIATQLVSTHPGSGNQISAK